MKAISLFDIAPQNQELDIVDVQGHPIGLVVELRPMSSPELQKVERDHKSAMYAAVRKNRDIHPLNDKLRENVICAAVVSFTWADKPTFNGAPLEKFDATKENLQSIARSRKLDWFGDQINEAMGDEKNFHKS
jgi:hypothetical protein